MTRRDGSGASAMVNIDWARFGLSSEPAARPAAAEPSASDPLAGPAQQHDELFAEEQVRNAYDSFHLTKSKSST